jgi:hypothetical protein
MSLVGRPSTSNSNTSRSRWVSKAHRLLMAWVSALSSRILSLERLFDDDEQGFGVNRLLDKMVGAGSHRGHRGWHVGVSGYHDDGRVAGGLSDAFEQINAVQAWQLIVENDAGRLVPLN